MRNFLERSIPGYRSREQGQGSSKPRKQSYRVFLCRVQAEASPFTFCKISQHSIPELENRDPVLGKEHVWLVSSLVHCTKTSLMSVRTRPNTEGGAGDQPGCQSKALLPVAERRGRGIPWTSTVCQAQHQTLPRHSLPVSSPHALSCPMSPVLAPCTGPPVFSLPPSPASGAPAAERPGDSSSLFQFFVIVLEALQRSDLVGWNKDPKPAHFTRLNFRPRRAGEKSFGNCAKP